MRHISALVIAAQLCVASPAYSGAKFERLQQKIDGAPVEVYVVSEDRARGAEWMAIPSGMSFPTAGVSIPELSLNAEMSTVVNANFYREDQPGFQEPLGLVVHQANIMSLPSSTYPTVGLIDGALEWDNVSFKGDLEIQSGSKIVRQKLCRFNARATKGCASLWMGKIPKSLKNAFYVAADGGGPAIGQKSYAPLEERPEDGTKLFWAIQWPDENLPQGVTGVTVHVRLKGMRLGEKWKNVVEAVSGSHVLTAKKAYPSLSRSWVQTRQPRALIGMTKDSRAFVAVFDGRRESSRGVSIKSAWNFLAKNFEAVWAVNLDGGGSTTLVHEGRLANKPSDGIPRAIAVAWGMRAIETPRPASHNSSK